MNKNKAELAEIAELESRIAGLESRLITLRGELAEDKPAKAGKKKAKKAKKAAKKVYFTSLEYRKMKYGDKADELARDPKTNTFEPHWKYVKGLIDVPDGFVAPTGHVKGKVAAHTKAKKKAAKKGK